jgi:Trk K+ transport system NAD-binding subunit
LKSLDQTTHDARLDLHPEIALLGFYRVASAFLTEVEKLRPQLKEKLVVVDFNPEVFRALKTRGINVVYGDISNMPTLHHAGIDEAKLVISSITDDILVGTDNFTLIRQIRKLCPQARIVVTAGSPSQALKLYKAGADYVLRPNSLAGHHLLEILDLLLRQGALDLVGKEVDQLSRHREVLA